MSWLLSENDGRDHVTPVGDLREHEFSETCWCHPTLDDNLVIHHSLDKREEYEEGRKPS